MSKKRFIVISDQGADGCPVSVCDTMKEAEEIARGAAASGANVHRPLEYAIYERVAITQTQLVSVDVLKIHDGDPN